MKTPMPSTTFAIIILAAGFTLGHVFDDSTTVNAQSPKVFELRTYTVLEGRLPKLLARFRDHTMQIFEKHAMHSVGFWVAQDSPAPENTLIYIIAHDSREAVEKNWAAFRADPEWQRVRAESQVDGEMVSHIESVFMAATEFSPMK
jgi:hypothetical protein